VADYFLKLDGIPGESTDAKHKDEIELVSFSWGVTQHAEMTARSVSSKYGTRVTKRRRSRRR